MTLIVDRTPQTLARRLDVPGEHLGECAGVCCATRSASMRSISTAGRVWTWARTTSEMTA